MKVNFGKARNFIYRNARAIELAQFQYFFENGDKDAVLTALEAYQNEDGGFGNALEPDSWNPNSSPIQTWAATEILRKINFEDREHSVVRGILKFLESGEHFCGNVWSSTILTNNDYPRARWWRADPKWVNAKSDPTVSKVYNPTAALAGFIVNFAEKGSSAYEFGERIVKAAVNAFLLEPVDDMHTTACFVQLLDWLKRIDRIDFADITAFEKVVRAAITRGINHDKSQYGVNYICKPSFFFNTSESVFYDDNKEIADFECGHIVQKQLGDGAWSTPFGWDDYPAEAAITTNWWRSYLAIENLLYLRGMGKL